ncbi:MAG: alternative ribosome rescue aminoacyl-tRNA hydrolase ArfB [Rhodanobacteraceae bacterium]
MRITRSIDIPEHELSESFVRASGPGGQHVNRTESAVELRFDIANSPSIPQRLRERLLGRGDRRITQDGVVVIQARRFRDQARNRDDARARLRALLLAATKPVKKRIPTRPTRGSKERRLKKKQERGKLKRTRSRNWSHE